MFKKNSWLKDIVLLSLGGLLGAAIVLNVLPLHNGNENLHIEPLFTDEMIVMFAEIRNFLVNVEENSNIIWCNADRGNLEDMRKHLSEAEIYFTTNKHLRSLPEAEQKIFYDSYQRWAADYRQKCIFAERMQNHENFPLSTEHIEVHVDFKFQDEVLQKYLQSFRKPVNVWDDHHFLQESRVQKILDLKSWKYFGEVREHESYFLQKVKLFYPYKIPEERRQKVAAFLREINPEFGIDKSGRCSYSCNEKITSDNGFFKLYPELQKLMDKNCRVEECLESVRKNPLSRRSNVEIIDMKPFQLK